MSISTALFDLDDTLIDSSMAIDSAIDLVFKSVGIQHLSGSEFSRSVRVRGGQLAEAFHALEVEEGVRIDLLHLYRSAYWNKAPGLVKLYPGVKDVLTQLHRSGIKLGIVTQKNWILDLDGFLVGASKELEELGIIELFSTGVGFENVVRYKPDPEGVLLALSTLNSNAENSVVIGDSPSDIKAGNSAGCFTCHAIWGPASKGEEVTIAEANLTLQTPSEILNLPFDYR